MKMTHQRWTQLTIAGKLTERSQPGVIDYLAHEYGFTVDQPEDVRDAEAVMEAMAVASAQGRELVLSVTTSRIDETEADAIVEHLRAAGIPFRMETETPDEGCFRAICWHPQMTGPAAGKIGADGEPFVAIARIEAALGEHAPGVEAKDASKDASRALEDIAALCRQSRRAAGQDGSFPAALELSGAALAKARKESETWTPWRVGKNEMTLP